MRHQGSPRDVIENFFERGKGPRIWGSVKKEEKKQGEKLSFEFGKAPDHGKEPIIGLAMSAHRRKSAKQKASIGETQQTDKGHLGTIVHWNISNP